MNSFAYNLYPASLAKIDRVSIIALDSKVIQNHNYYDRSAIDTFEAEEAYQFKPRFQHFHVNFADVKGAEVYVWLKYKTNRLKKTMINHFNFFDKEQITEQEYGQLTFDRFAYNRPFENGVFDPAKDELKIIVALDLDANEEITEVEQIGEPAYYIIVLAIVYAYGLIGSVKVGFSFVVDAFEQTYQLGIMG